MGSAGIRLPACIAWLPCPCLLASLLDFACSKTFGARCKLCFFMLLHGAAKRGAAKLGFYDDGQTLKKL